MIIFLEKVPLYVLDFHWNMFWENVFKKQQNKLITLVSNTTLDCV